METIQIDTLLYQKLMDYGINIQVELEKLANSFSQKKDYSLREKEIARVVENSQRIEGYEPASSDIKQKIKLLMEAQRVKVSF